MSAERLSDIIQPAPVPAFDWRRPNYPPILRERAAALQRIRANPDCLPQMKLFYRANPAHFINDWALLAEPRNVEVGLPVVIPFLLFPRQFEWVDFIMDCWRKQESGLTEKSRDCGLSWLSVCLACTLCLFHDNMVIGFGSRKEDYVDKIGAPKSLFWKARFFMRNIPREFRGGWLAERDARRMLIDFPESHSYMTGEAGDNIGRGDRTAITVIDEAAHLDHADLIEAALSQTTNCRQDISSVNGMSNVFAEKRWSGRVRVFIFDHRDDPRKGEEWYAKTKARLDPVTLAQEVDRDYNASAEGIVIPQVWVRAAIDAHVKLKIKPTGDKYAALDVADEGRDMNALCGAYGVAVEYLEEWSGVGSDPFRTTETAINICHARGYRKLRYDADGLGANVRGDARVINERRRKANVRAIAVEAFRGSGEVEHPEKEDVEGWKNEDYFANHKAQAWWALRTRFHKTYAWVVEGRACDPDDIISLSSQITELHKLCAELSQPTFTPTGAGKMVIDKTPDGVRSPNRADSVMMRMAGGGHRPLRIAKGLLARV